MRRSLRTRRPSDRGLGPGTLVSVRRAPFPRRRAVPDLGRRTRRHFGGAGAIDAGGRGEARDPGGDVRRGALHHRRPGLDPWVRRTEGPARHVADPRCHDGRNGHWPIRGFGHRHFLMPLPSRSRPPHGVGRLCRMSGLVEMRRTNLPCARPGSAGDRDRGRGWHSLGGRCQKRLGAPRRSGNNPASLSWNHGDQGVCQGTGPFDH